MRVLNLLMLWMTCIVDVYCLYVFCNSFLEKRNWVKERAGYRWLVLCLTVVSIFIINIFGNGDINLLLVPIVYLIFGFVLYSSRHGSTFICILIGFSIIFGCECLFAMLFSRTNSSFRNLASIATEVCCVKLITYFVFVLIVQLIGRKNRKMEKWLFLRYLFIPLAGIGMMVTVFYSRTTTYHAQMDIAMVLCFVFMLLGNLLIFSAFNQYTENLYVAMEQKVLLTKQDSDIRYYRDIVKNDEAHYQIIHDMKHNLEVIYQLAMQKDEDTIVRVLDELNLQINNSALTIYSEESHILNLMLSEAAHQAEKAHIRFDAYVEPGIKVQMVQDSDLISMTKNLLDNAMRASEECKTDPFITVRIFMQETGGFCVMKITNRFEGALQMEHGELRSTKKEAGMHGLGLKSVNRIAERYGGYLEYKVDNDIFEAVVLLSTLAETANID